MRLQSSELLRVFMQERAMSHRRLARYAGCSLGFIAHLTSGRRRSCTPRLAERIAEALDVPVTVLFVAEVSPVKQQKKQRKAAA